MTNGEKYEKEILDIVYSTGKHPAILGGKLIECTYPYQCDSCIWGGCLNCNAKFSSWVKENYKGSEIDWSKVPVDTKILVRDSKKDPWHKAHFARIQNNIITVFTLDRSSWTALEDNTFSSYRYADIPDPEERKKYLKNE